MKLNKYVKAYVEAELRGYRQTAKELEEARNDIFCSSPAPPDGMPKGERISDSTYDVVVKLMTSKRILYLERLLYAIETVVNELDNDKMRLVNLKYWERPRRLTDAGIAVKLNIDRRTVYRWTDTICFDIAIELGLVDEIDCHKDVTFGIKKRDRIVS